LKAKEKSQQRIIKSNNEIEIKEIQILTSPIEFAVCTSIISALFERSHVMNFLMMLTHKKIRLTFRWHVTAKPVVGTECGSKSPELAVIVLGHRESSDD